MGKLNKCPLCGGTNLEYYGPKFVPDNFCNDCKKFVWEQDNKKYVLTEREKNAPDYEYTEEFSSFEGAKKRMREMVFDETINKNPQAISAYEVHECSAVVHINDGNEFSWDIETKTIKE